MAVFSTLRRAGAALAILGTLVASESNPFFNSELPEGSSLDKRQSGTYAITGATNSQTTQPRLEIRQLEQNADQWNLFLLAMQDFKGMDQAPIDSYYSISEIHGVPNVPWDGVQGVQGGGVGYCNHVSALFPAWHRAYTALFEQAFVNHVNTIVNQFQGADQQRYAAAASTIRVPYWDWAAVPPSGQPVLPASITDLFVTLQTPTGSQQVLNPLFRYDFHPLDHAGMMWDPWDNWNVTLRYPTDTTPQSTDFNQGATDALQSDNPSLRSRIYNLMTQCNDYQGFSQGDPSQRPPQCQEALEDIHNNIHNDIGGSQSGHQGHMAIIPVASYDPAFWMHHMNVDRMFALWQSLYPNSYTVNSHTAQASFAVAANTQVNGDTFLAPFHAGTNGQPHTTNSVRDTNTFKYTYPELTSGDTSPSGMMAKINALYGSGAAPASKRSVNNPYKPKYGVQERALASEATSAVGAVMSGLAQVVPSGVSPVSPATPLSTGSSLRPSNSSSYTGNPNWQLPPNLADQLTPTKRAPIDYSCRVTIQPYNLGGTSRIYVFLGTPASENPDTWAKDSHCVGWSGTFASPGMQTNTLTAATIPLTSALLKQQANGAIAGIGLNQTMPLLQKQLTWRVAGPNGVIPNDQAPGLTVGVHTANVKPAKSNNDFPQWGSWQVQHEATHGKAGGIQSGMPGDWHNLCEPTQ